MLTAKVSEPHLGGGGGSLRLGKFLNFRGFLVVAPLNKICLLRVKFHCKGRVTKYGEIRGFDGLFLEETKKYQYMIF